MAATAATSVFCLMPGSRVLGANDRIGIAIVGCGGRGRTSFNQFNRRDGAEVVAVCDPDLQRMDNVAGERSVAKYQDYRKLLEDKAVDAVVLSTPNHWHALGTIMACQAGKDVYVEKPASHSIWEGRKMVEAARKYNRVVQVGTQQRSDPAFISLRERLANKDLGEIQWIHSLWYAARGEIGNVTEPRDVPDHIDYDQWCGPRPLVPLMRRRFHYDWHWIWDYGNGDMGNRVVHVIDDIHHVLQMNTDIPKRMMSVGGRFKYEDNANTPNTQYILMEWNDIPIIFSSRNLPHVNPEGQARGTSVYSRFGHNHRFTNLIKCEGGFYGVSRGGGHVYDNDGNRIEQIRGNGGRGHIPNFIASCRSRSIEELAADVEQGHLSSVMLHTGNISYRVGQAASVETVNERVNHHEESKENWQQMVEHLRDNDVDLAVDRPTLGPWLTFDPESERFTGEHASEANSLVKETYREPFTIPEDV